MKSYGQKVVAVELRITECEHILNLLRDNEGEGSYYGNEQQYRHRAERIEQSLVEAMKEV